MYTRCYCLFCKSSCHSRKLHSFPTRRSSDLELIGRALKGKRRETVVIATKFAWKFGPNNEQIGLDSSPANIKKSIEGSLRDRKSTRLNSSHTVNSYAVFCLKKKNNRI